jgi:hypothetical protein
MVVIGIREIALVAAPVGFGRWLRDADTGLVEPREDLIDLLPRAAVEASENP